MNRCAWMVLVVAMTACSPEQAAAPARTGPLSPWDPVDDAFAGCAESCGSHVEGAGADVVAQPGAVVGDRTYCPVSGAVFEVDADHPHVEVDRHTLWFCCAACARYFAAHRDAVLDARGIAHDG